MSIQVFPQPSSSAVEPALGLVITSGANSTDIGSGRGQQAYFTSKKTFNVSLPAGVYSINTNALLTGYGNGTGVWFNGTDIASATSVSLITLTTDITSFDVEYLTAWNQSTGNVQSVGTGGVWASQPAGSTLNNIAYGVGYYVIPNSTSFLGANRVVISTDGVNWTTRTSGASQVAQRNAIRFVNGYFMYADSSATGILTLSTDALNWATRLLITSNINSPGSFSFLNGFYFAGTSGSNIVYSTNLTNWTSIARTNAGPQSAAGNGYGVIGGAGGSNIVYWTTNGTTWTTASTGTIDSGNGQGQITFGNGTFVYTGDGGRVAVSTNATTWTIATLPWTSAQLTDIKYANGWFLAAAPGTNTSPVNWGFFASTDGITWAKGQSSASPNSLPVIVWGTNGGWITSLAGTAGAEVRRTASPVPSGTPSSTLIFSFGRYPRNAVVSN